MTTESSIMHRVMLALSAMRCRVFRNNVGLTPPIPPDNRRVQYGLCPGSSDLIGWRVATITPDMIGRRVAIFMAVEVKQPGRHPTKEQRNFLSAVKHAGGIALTVHSEIDAVSQLKAEPFRE